mmetsp:Transcript_9546/g.29724  ORF Transcript_9546/g.29724 Transcript_9546/m.29724 type:complete len:311 (+) Transcript_9546:178-1110(+)
MVAHLATSRGAEEGGGAPGQALAAEALVNVRLDGAPAPAHDVLALGRPGPRLRRQCNFPLGKERRVGGRLEAALLANSIGLVARRAQREHPIQGQHACPGLHRGEDRADAVVEGRPVPGLGRPVAHDVVEIINEDLHVAAFFRFGEKIPPLLVAHVAPLQTAVAAAPERVPFVDHRGQFNIECRAHDGPALHQLQPACFAAERRGDLERHIPDAATNIERRVFIRNTELVCDLLRRAREDPAVLRPPLAVRPDRPGPIASSYPGPLLDVLEGVPRVVLGGLEAGIIFGDGQRRAVVSAPAPPAALRVLFH